MRTQRSLCTQYRGMGGVLALLVMVLAAGCSADDLGADGRSSISDVSARAQEVVTAPPVAAVASTTTEAGPRTESVGEYKYAFNVAYSPSFVDPQEYPSAATPFVAGFAIHDALVRHLPGHPFAPSLASSYEISDDFMSATFTLRPGIKFHNGDPVTSEDVKFTFENYSGANSKTLKERTDRIDTPDARTVRFIFKQPFLDFLVLYGSHASGAGWIVPKDYYLDVGPDGFKQRPIGAGPYKFVSADGSDLKLEAFADYWRRTPAVKSLVIKYIPDSATRFAALVAGEVDLITSLPASLYDAAQSAGMSVFPTRSGEFWLEMPGWERPESPFHDVRVRKAVSLAIDRRANSDAEAAGLAPVEATWIPQEWQGAIQPADAPDAWRTDVIEAKRLMAEAGYPDGFEVSQLTPLPPFNSLGERVVGQLAAIGIRTKLNPMERAAFLEALTKGVDALPGLILNLSSTPGDAASRVRSFATCEGASSRTCIPEVDAKFAEYEASTDPDERKRLITEVQRMLLDQYVFPYVFSQSNLTVTGPRVTSSPGAIWQAIPQFPLLGPYEDVTVE